MFESVLEGGGGGIDKAFERAAEKRVGTDAMRGVRVLAERILRVSEEWAIARATRLNVGRKVIKIGRCRWM